MSCVAAIGNFDGFHRGHQALIGVAQAEAAKRGVPCGILTFEPHPRRFFRPDEPMFRLTPPAMKERLAKALGLDFVKVLDFDPSLAALSAQDFVEREIVAGLGACHVVTGYDFHFGKGRMGSPDMLRALGDSLGFGVSIVQQVTDESGVSPFSSSAIRQYLRQGHVREAASQLGYWWRIAGLVVQGDQRGRTIGFPTANVALEPGMEAREGIYAARVRIGGTGAFWKGAAYIGKRPTFDTDRRFLEIYLIGFEGDIYGQTIDAEFVDFIRPDQKFDGLDALIAQMNADCAVISQRLDGLARQDPMRGFPLGLAAAEARV
ncbi:MAG: bifunctional riboflavin kinase/FAD synthetase [Aestuariivirgaceae bacterium]|nr:bifunctional riboflavin kinase/FAD synthetase [Aestuariivirgaceae bacterium]